MESVVLEKAMKRKKHPHILKMSKERARLEQEEATKARSLMAVMDNPERGIYIQRKEEKRVRKGRKK